MTEIPNLDELFQAGRDDIPDELSRARMQRAVLAAVAGAGASAAASTAAASTAVATGTALKGGAIGTGFMLKGTIGVVLMSATIATVATVQPFVPSDDVTVNVDVAQRGLPVQRPMTVVDPAARASRIAITEPVEPLAPEPASVEVISPVDAPTATTRVARPSVSLAPEPAERSQDPAVMPAPVRETPSVALLEEARLVEQALNALQRGDPSQAERALEEHSARYPAGVLEEERQATRILILCARGQRDQAAAMRAAFTRRWPASSSINRIDSLCAQR